MVRQHKIEKRLARRTKKEANRDLGEKILEVLKYSRVGDMIIFEDSNGFIFTIKLTNLHPPEKTWVE